jgi:thiamine pyrophosphokinase
MEQSEMLLKPLQPLVDGSDSNIVLIQLNSPLEHNGSKFLFKTLWNKAMLKAVVDGGVNHLFDCFGNQPDCDTYLPDIISGDFDSAKPELLEFYKSKGTEIIHTPDQNYTDFTKCLNIVVERLKTNEIKVDCIVVHVNFNGRLDHIFSLFNTLYSAVSLTDLPVFLLSGSGLGCLLNRGKYKIAVDTGLEGETCGLIPIGCGCDHVTTSGLKWNLKDQRLKFGELVSSSNGYDGASHVTIETDTPLLWTMELDLQSGNTKKSPKTTSESTMLK